MTIHHDKLAYGKLASSMEEMKEDEILDMLKLLNEQEEEENGQQAQVEKDKKNNIKKL